jgi:hypothetical protein
MSIDLSQGGRPLSKEEKCTLYSISSEDYFKCLKSANVQLFSPTQALPAGAVVAIIIVIFIILLALDIKYEVNFFSSFFGGIGSLFSSLFSNRVSRRRRY